MTKKHPMPQLLLQLGQIWELGDSRLQISFVGKRLVHYRRFKGKKHWGASGSMAAIQEMEEYLRRNKAVLVHQ
jgi:hypothetical protein